LRRFLQEGMALCQPGTPPLALHCFGCAHSLSEKVKQPSHGEARQ
jgi:hypothetical protein